MKFEPVDIIVLDSISQQPIVGVVVKILSQDGKLIYGTATTDDTGTASFLLPAGSVYQSRYYKFAVSFGAPQLIDLTQANSTPPPQSFTVYGTSYVYPQSDDPRLCLANGFVLTPSGQPAKHVDMQFIATFDPVLLDGNVVLVERVTVHTNKEGYVEVPLIRFGIYEVTVQGMEDMYRKIHVPDAPRVNIGDLLLPVVTNILFDLGPGPFTLPVGDEITLTPTVYTSDLRTLADITSDVLWSLSDSTIIGFRLTPTTITIVGMSPGTAQLVANRRPFTPIRIPNTPIAGVPVTFTVTP